MIHTSVNLPRRCAFVSTCTTAAEAFRAFSPTLSQTKLCGVPHLFACSAVAEKQLPQLHARCVAFLSKQRSWRCWRGVPLCSVRPITGQTASRRGLSCAAPTTELLWRALCGITSTGSQKKRFDRGMTYNGPAERRRNKTGVLIGGLGETKTFSCNHAFCSQFCASLFFCGFYNKS